MMFQLYDCHNELLHMKTYQNCYITPLVCAKRCVLTLSTILPLLVVLLLLQKQIYHRTVPNELCDLH